MKYEYLLRTWGDFYNDEFVDVHGKLSGYHYFDTEEERQTYIDGLEDVRKCLGTKVQLAMDLSEGFHCKIIVTLHRVTKYEGKLYHTTKELGPNYPYHIAMHHLEWTRAIGVRDYPLGETFDYSNVESYEVVQGWITGAFTIEN